MFTTVALPTVRDFQDTDSTIKPDTSSKWLAPARRMAILEHWTNACAYCGDMLSDSNPAQFDHVINGPIVGGHQMGCNESWNVVPACKSCNQAKGFSAGTVTTFLARNAGAVAITTGQEFTATFNAIADRFFGRLYSPVQGLEFSQFPGANVLANTYVIAASGLKNGRSYTYRGPSF